MKNETVRELRETCLAVSKLFFVFTAPLLSFWAVLYSSGPHIQENSWIYAIFAYGVFMLSLCWNMYLLPEEGEVPTVFFNPRFDGFIHYRLGLRKISRITRTVWWKIIMASLLFPLVLLYAVGHFFRSLYIKTVVPCLF